ncbi:MAG: hypothetical protein ABI284_02475 [Nitrosospira sp.]
MGVIDMGKQEKRVYLEAIRKRYRRAKRADKGKILDEFCSVCSYQRKYAIRLWGCKPAKSARRSGRPSQYDQPALLRVLRKLSPIIPRLFLSSSFGLAWEVLVTDPK